MLGVNQSIEGSTVGYETPYLQGEHLLFPCSSAAADGPSVQNYLRGPERLYTLTFPGPGEYDVVLENHSPDFDPALAVFSTCTSFDPGICYDVDPDKCKYDAPTQCHSSQDLTGPGQNETIRLRVHDYYLKRSVDSQLINYQRVLVVSSTTTGSAADFTLSIKPDGCAVLTEDIVGLAIPDATGDSAFISMNEDQAIASISSAEFEITLDHPAAQELRIWLLYPQGNTYIRSLIYDQRDSGPFGTKLFDVSNLLSGLNVPEEAFGLEIQDVVAGNTGATMGARGGLNLDQCEGIPCASSRYCPPGFSCDAVEKQCWED